MQGLKSIYVSKGPPWRICCFCKYVNLRHSLGIDILSTPGSSIPENFAHGKSILVQVMAWCRWATSHHLSHWTNTKWHKVKKAALHVSLIIWCMLENAFYNPRGQLKIGMEIMRPVAVVSQRERYRSNDFTVSIKFTVSNGAQSKAWRELPYSSASCKIRTTAGCAYAGSVRNVFPATAG